MLTVAEALLWWDVGVLERILAWAEATWHGLPTHVRPANDDADPSDLPVAMGLLHMLHDEYNVAPEHRLWPDEISLLLQTTAHCTVFMAHAEPEHLLPMTSMIMALDETRRGWSSFLPSGSENDAGDRVDLTVLPPSKKAKA